MNITDVRVRRVAKEGKMKAVVSITIDEEFVVHDIKVIEGEKGLFIAMPSRKATDGEYRDIAHPINSATRERIQNIILEKYNNLIYSIFMHFGFNIIYVFLDADIGFFIILTLLYLLITPIAIHIRNKTVERL